jgi:isopropylmalate/homocitrate/citramalate synthase
MPDTAGLLEESQSIKMFEFACNFTDKELAAHFHNDYGNSLGNTLAVIKRGLAREAQVSIYGLGSGAGIADHYEVSANLIDNLNIDTGENRRYFQNLYRTFQAITKIPIPWNHPLSNVARTEKAGTHQAQQLKSPEGYIPSKKLKYDFENKIFFEFGRLTSKSLIFQLLEDFDLDKKTADEIAKVIGRRSSLLNRKLSAREIKNIVGEVANYNIPISKVSQYISPEKAFYLLKVTPMVTTEITEKIENLKGVDRVLEAFGSYDIIIESYAHGDMQRKIGELLGSDIIEICPLIVG